MFLLCYCEGSYDPFLAADKRKQLLCHKNFLFSFFRKLIELLKTETVHFVKSVKLVSVYVKLLKPLEPKVSETETGFDITNTLNILTVTDKLFTTFGIIFKTF